MTEYERQQARKYQKDAELLKTPEGRAALEGAKRKAEENKRRNEILENWGRNGFYKAQMPNTAQRKETAEEQRRAEILKHYS